MGGGITAAATAIKKERGNTMKKERIVIDEALCRMVELMLKGGANRKEIRERLGVSSATISRIKTAGFNAAKYAENTARRVMEEKEAAGAAETAKPAEEQAPGQLAMELPVDYAEAMKTEREITTEGTEKSDMVKMMRFQAAQVDKLIMKLDQIYNMASMILRAVRKE